MSDTNRNSATSGRRGESKVAPAQNPADMMPLPSLKRPCISNTLSTLETAPLPCTAGNRQ